MKLNEEKTNWKKREPKKIPVVVGAFERRRTTRNPATLANEHQLHAGNRTKSNTKQYKNWSHWKRKTRKKTAVDSNARKIRFPSFELEPSAARSRKKSIKASKTITMA